MKYIRNISDEQNKVGDTSNVFRLNLFEDTQLFNFGDNQLTVNVANGSGYVLSLTPEKETGNTVIDLDFNDAPLKELTPDDYLLEVEVKFGDGTTATFPTKGGMPFTVNGNLKGTLGKLVPTVTFDNVLAAVDEKIAVYMDTVKVGPAGPVGPAGNVDTSNDNTFTGVNAFTKPISGALKTRTATFTDFVTVAAGMIVYSGNWYVGNVAIANIPSSGMTYYTVEVIPDISGTAGIIRIAQFTTGNYYYNIVSNGLLTGWHKIARDEGLIHNVGTETAAGNKTFTGNNIFTQLIDGYTKTKTAPNTDLNLLVSSGKYQVENTYTNIPTGMPNSAVMYVENNTAGTVIYQFVLSRSVTVQNSDINVFMRMQINNTWTPWRTFATDDRLLMHLSGDEVSNGDKTFRSGNYGLRVTTTGIQKTSDNGVTWSNI